MSVTDIRLNQPKPPLPKIIRPGNAVNVLLETGGLPDPFDLRSVRLGMGVPVPLVAGAFGLLDETTRETANPATQNNAIAHKTVIFERKRLVDSLAMTVSPLSKNKYEMVSAL